jgi:hypothetical protein
MISISVVHDFMNAYINDLGQPMSVQGAVSASLFPKTVSIIEVKPN